MSMMKRTACCNDAVSFMQCWNKLGQSDLKKFFYDMEKSTYPLYKIND